MNFTDPNYDDAINMIILISTKIKVFLLTEDAQNAKTGAYKRLGDSLRANPQYLFKVPQEGKDIIIYRNGAYPGVSTNYSTEILLF